MSDEEPTRIAFLCVRNAGRSQMATAFTKRALERRGVAEDIEIRTGGTDPADEVHDVVVQVMQEAGIDLSERSPRKMTTGEMASCDYVVTMGCSTLEFDASAAVDVRDWALEDPHGTDVAGAREIRDRVGRNVTALLEEILDAEPEP